MIEAKAFEAVQVRVRCGAERQMVLRTSEDEQLLGKALQALQDYLQIANYFDSRERITATFAYLAEATTTFVTRCSSKPAQSQQSLSPLDAADSDTDAWKCIHVVQLLFRLATHYASSLETVSPPRSFHP